MKHVFSKTIVVGLAFSAAAMVHADSAQVTVYRSGSNNTIIGAEVGLQFVADNQGNGSGFIYDTPSYIMILAKSNETGKQYACVSSPGDADWETAKRLSSIHLGGAIIGYTVDVGNKCKTINFMIDSDDVIH